MLMLIHRKNVRKKLVVSFSQVQPQWRSGENLVLCQKISATAKIEAQKWHSPPLGLQHDIHPFRLPYPHGHHDYHHHHHNPHHHHIYNHHHHRDDGIRVRLTTTGIAAGRSLRNSLWVDAPPYQLILSSSDRDIELKSEIVLPPAGLQLIFSFQDLPIWIFCDKTAKGEIQVGWSRFWCWWWGWCCCTWGDPSR